MLASDITRGIKTLACLIYLIYRFFQIFQIKVTGQTHIVACTPPLFSRSQNKEDAVHRCSLARRPILNAKIVSKIKTDLF